MESVGDVSGLGNATEQDYTCFHRIDRGQLQANQQLPVWSRDRAGIVTKRPLPILNWVSLTCLTLTTLKLWLTAGQTLYALGWWLYDDLHFLTQASYLLRGEWLGPYDQLTLIKGPFFPAWIALAHLAGVPLLLSAQILYVAACWLLSLAVRPLLKRNLYTPIFYAFLLFNPESAGVSRVLRELISPALTLVTAACATGLLLAQESGDRKGGWWAAGLGASFAALWLTREEGMVVLPFLVFVFACAIFRARRTPAAGHIRHVARTWLVSLLVWAVLVYSVAAINLARYGLFAKTEFDAYSFNAALGALSRVKPPDFKPFVSVTKKTRPLIYRVSPAFSELRPYLEGTIGARWAREGAYMHSFSNRHEILADWFGWALRDAVSAAGYYQRGTYPDEYYSRLAREVNAACDRRLLDCYAPRATILPVWHYSYVRPLLATFLTKLDGVVGFDGVRLDPSPSSGTPEQLAFYRGMTGNQVTPPEQSSIEIQGVALKSEIRFDVKDAAGAPVPLDSHRGASPDFYAYLAARGEEIPAAASAQYLLQARCSDQCSLEIRVGGALQDRIRLADLRPTVGVFENNNLIYRILYYEPRAVLSPEEARLSAARLAALKGDLRTYQMLNPILAVVALLAYVLLTINVLRRRSADKLWILLTGFALLCLSRIALISLFNVLFATTSPVEYLEEAYPILLAFVGLAGLPSLDGAVDRLRRRVARAAPQEIRAATDLK